MREFSVLIAKKNYSNAAVMWEGSNLMGLERVFKDWQRRMQGNFQRDECLSEKMSLMK